MSLKRFIRPSKSLYSCICMNHREIVHSGRYLRRPVNKSLYKFYCSSKLPTDDILDMVKKLQELPVEEKQEKGDRDLRTEEREDWDLRTKEREDWDLRTEEREDLDLRTEEKQDSRTDRYLDSDSLEKKILARQDKFNLENTERSKSLDRFTDTSDQSIDRENPDEEDSGKPPHVVHAKLTRNNIIVSLTNESGDHVITTSSCGNVGFRNAKKKTDIALQHLVQDIASLITITDYDYPIPDSEAESEKIKVQGPRTTFNTTCGHISAYNNVFKKAKRNGVSALRIKIKGFEGGPTRFIKAMVGTGIKIVSVTDVTHVPLNGNKPRKKKR